MKRLFVGKIHSVVDLITNSSSELFVCNSNKSIKTVKEVLQQLLQPHGYSFKNAFGNVYICDLDFSDSPIYKKWRDFRQYSSNYYNLWPKQRYKEFDIKDELDFKRKDWENSQPKFQYYKWPCDQKDPKFDKEAYDKYCKYSQEYNYKNHEFLKSLYKPWTEILRKLYIELITYYTKLNNIDCSEIKLIKNDTFFVDNFYPDFTNITDKNLVDFIEKFEDFILQNIIVPKGSLIIQSKEDNSIPYEIFDSINSIFNGCNYRLG